jgi:hypothetical protein
MMMAAIAARPQQQLAIPAATTNIDTHGHPSGSGRSSGWCSLPNVLFNFICSNLTMEDQLLSTERICQSWQQSYRTMMKLCTALIFRPIVQPSIWPHQSRIMESKMLMEEGKRRRNKHRVVYGFATLLAILGYRLQFRVSSSFPKIYGYHELLMSITLNRFYCHVGLYHHFTD